MTADIPAESGGAVSGSIVLVATPIGNLGDLSPRAKQALSTADIIACEDTRHTGKLLELSGIAPAKLVCLNEHNEEPTAADLLARAQQGLTIAVVTDAGTPGISDPPSQLVARAQAAGVTVDAIPGPSALLVGLSLSGLDMSRFVFEGFLPRSGAQRTERLAALAREPRTIVLFESPHRLKKTLRDLAGVCGQQPDQQAHQQQHQTQQPRRAALARELTKLHQQVVSGTLSELADQAEQEHFPIKGEFVIIIEGAPEAPIPSEADILTALRAELAAGASPRDAAANVAASLGVPKRRAYELSIKATSSDN